MNLKYEEVTSSESQVKSGQIMSKLAEKSISKVVLEQPRGHQVSNFPGVLSAQSTIQFVGS